MTAGELHITKAFLRAIGTFCDGNEMPELCEVRFNKCVVQQIIAVTDVRRAIKAPKHALITLYECYLVTF